MRKQILFLFILLSSAYSFAQTSTFSGSGNWNSAARWSNGIPTAGTAVTIANGATCTVNVANAVCASLTVASGGSNTSVTITNGNMLDVSGNVLIDIPTGNNRLKLIDVNAGTLEVGGNITLGNSSSGSRDMELRIGSGICTITGSLISNGSATENLITFNASNDGDLNIGGSITGNATLTELTGTITFNNAGAQNIRTDTYHNLGVAGSGDKTMTGDVTVSGTLNLAAGNLAINGNTLTLNGDVTRTSGNLKGSSTSNLVISGSGANASISFDQTNSANRSLNNFTLSRSNGATLIDTVEIDNVLTINNSSTLNTNNKLILVSTASATARVADLSAGTVSGKVIAQRYVPGGTDRRRWRFFSSPVNISGNYNYYQFIDDIHVTGAGGATNGFDNSPNNSASARVYNETVSGASSNGWANPSVLNTNIPVGRGVSVFVRGSRSTQDPFLNWATPDNVTVDFTGDLNQGTYDISSLLTYTNTGTPTADGFNLIGNPYMSQIDWMSANITKTNIGNVIYILNPASGAYATFDVGTQTALNGGSRYIASGQGFFVRTTAGGASVVFNETAKTSQTAPDLFKVGYRGATLPKIRLRAIRNADNMDELVVILGDTAHKTSVDASDAAKFFNDNNLNFYTRTPQLTNLGINYYPKPSSNDTISLSLFSFVDGIKAYGTYSIRVDEILNLPANIDVFLKDNYTNQLVNLKEANNYVFDLDLNAASAGNDRFKLIFMPDTTTATRITNFYAAASGKKININWIANREIKISHYVVEKSLDQRKYSVMKPVQINAYNNNESYNLYSIVDNAPTKGYNYYRVSMVDSNGNKKPYGEIIAVNYDPKGNSSVQAIVDNNKTVFDSENKISVFPNPANSSTTTTVYTDEIENNTIEIYDINAKLVLKYEQLSGENRTIDISNLEKGLYLIRSVSANTGKSYTSKFIKE